MKNNQTGITLFLTEFLKTHPPALYPREIIIIDNATQPAIIIPKTLADGGLNITILHCDNPGLACARNVGIQHAQSEILMPFLAIPSHRYDETDNSTNLVRAFTEDNLIASQIVSRRKIYRHSLKSFPPGGIER